jgi:hypothetical protein
VKIKSGKLNMNKNILIVGTTIEHESDIDKFNSLEEGVIKRIEA